MEQSDTHAWQRKEPTEIHKVGWRTVVMKRFQLPNGVEHDFGTMGLEGSRCIATIALTADNEVIVAEQFRPGPEKIMQELPGGGVEATDIDLETAARRELLEETGYEAGAMEYLGTVYKDAYTNTSWHYFLARGCTLHPQGAQPDEREFIDIKLISAATLIANACSGLMTDPEAVLLAYETLQQL